MPSRKYASMLSKAELKTIRSLHEAKGRTTEGSFIAEGLKVIEELLGAFPCSLLIVSLALADEAKARLLHLPREARPQRVEVVPESFDWGRISTLRQPRGALAVFVLPATMRTSVMVEGAAGAGATPAGLSLFLDRVQDPGNLGTILRSADWFGVQDVFLALGTADPYAPKVVQATMGALARVRLHRVSDSLTFLRGYEGELLGTFLDGEDLYTATLPPPSSPHLLIMGNEGQGIHPEIASIVGRRLTIPAYPRDREHTESLNVAIATSLLLAELRRRG